MELDLTEAIRVAGDEWDRIVERDTIAEIVRTAAPIIERAVREREVGQRRVRSVWYRAVWADGTTWCETSSKREVVAMSKDMDVTYQRAVTYEVKTGWEPWQPENDDA